MVDFINKICCIFIKSQTNCSTAVLRFMSIQNFLFCKHNPPWESLQAELAHGVIERSAAYLPTAMLGKDG